MGENVKPQSEYSVNILITKGSITIFILIYGLFFFCARKSRVRIGRP